MGEEASISDRDVNELSNIPNVLSLGHEAATSAEAVGAKASNLAKLRLAGFPVPSGIVVTTAAFARHLESISEVEDGSSIRLAILSNSLSASIKEELWEALEEIGDVPFAVRSSGVEEDLEGASFAGQYDTFLGVRGLTAVEEAVRKCFASAFSDQILKYRTSKIIKSEHMAVLIQPLVEADAAGVVFTANPVTGNRNEVIVSAVQGLGERLVSGEASPDEWVVQGDQAIAKCTPERAVSSKQVIKIAELARRVEAYYGEPQDIEWAICKNHLYLLQARPITTLAEEGTADMIPVPVTVPVGFWEREESHYPDPLMPITYTTFVPAVNRAFRLLCDEMSLLIETMEVREIGGYIYQRVVPLGGKDRKAPPAWIMPLLIRMVPQLRKRIAGSVRAIREDIAGKWLDAWDMEWKQALISRAEQIRSKNLHTLLDGELARHIEESRGFLRDSTELHMKINGSVQLILAKYAFACQELLGWNESQMMRMFCGLSEMSSAPVRALAALAQYAQSQHGLVQDITSGVPLPELLHRYPDFAQKFNDYMRAFGCRAIRYELAFPTVAETPETILRLLTEQLQRNYSPDDDSRFLKKQRRNQLTLAGNILKKKTEADRIRFKKVLSRAEKAYPLREEHGFYDRDVPLALLRYALIEAGNRLVERGHVNKMNDVFFLSYDELIETLKSGSSIREIVHHRQCERNWVLAHPGPASYGKRPSSPPSMESFPEEARFSATAVLWTIEKTFEAERSGRVQADAKRIQGIAASAGRYTGTVRIVHGESEFGKIQPGDILVCPITSPVWSMVFPSIGALVTDSGGILSHSAIIAREYRIPAVVAAGNATGLLKDGQLVTIDGSSGMVEALS